MRTLLDVTPMIRRCERCGSPMDLFACEPQLGTLPELRSYRCSCCRHVETDAGSVGLARRGEVYRVESEAVP